MPRDASTPMTRMPSDAIGTGSDVYDKGADVLSILLLAIGSAAWSACGKPPETPADESSSNGIRSRQIGRPKPLRREVPGRLPEAQQSSS
jgi:hypothetical protein